MKQKFIKGAIILGTSVLLTIGMLALFPIHSSAQNQIDEQINLSETVEMHFEGYSVKVIRCDSEQIKIKQSLFHKTIYGEMKDISFNNDELNIKLENTGNNSYAALHDSYLYQPQLWLSLMQFEKYFEYTHEIWDQQFVDYYIYAPNNLKIKMYSSALIGHTHSLEFASAR